jgi:transglutaminase-like putative cysteine protease
MIYGVRHRTTYKYGAEVGFARCVLRLTPATTATQTVLHSALRITPRCEFQTNRIGPFGETVTTVLIQTPHRVLEIEATARVDLHAPPIEESQDSPPWERVRDQALQGTDLGPDGPGAYLYPTARTQLVDTITDYARVSFTPGRPILSAAGDLMRRMNADFVFDSSATEVTTPAAEAFQARRGVCQDFAHIMIAGVRGLGLPAAYVSGYLRTIPPAGKSRLEGADATHAWVALWCGDQLGWIGFDPTNAVLAQNDHIVLATGRDYSDVAPIDGVILAPGRQTLKVQVDVIPEPEPAVLAEANVFLVR